MVLDGTYHYWDSLNTIYQLDTIKTRLISHADILSVYLLFDGRLNGYILSNFYGIMPGVWHFENRAVLFDESRLYIGRDNSGQICFLADIGWGDCLAGCTGHKYFYFRQEWDRDNRIYRYIFVGSFKYGEPTAEWWAEAYKLKDDWSNYGR
jgi:hypothetical protein